MYGVGMTSTSAPSLKENGDLLLEKYAHAISVALTTSTVFQTEQQRSRSATTQQLTLLYIRELKLSALRSIYRPASHLTGHKLTTFDGNTGVGRDGPALIEQYLNRCQGHWFESQCVQFFVKCLSALLLQITSVIFRSFTSPCGLAL